MYHFIHDFISLDDLEVVAIFHNDEENYWFATLDPVSMNRVCCTERILCTL
jgi:hypothetical protein